MQISDQKPSFFDINGDILAAGRLRAYLLDNTTPQNLYADPDFLVLRGSTIVLSDAGWANDTLFSPVDVVVHVDQYKGQDEFDAPIYQEIKQFSVIGGSAVTPAASFASVTTVDLLRAAAISDAVLVTGYNAAGDCPARLFVWSASNASSDNGGSVIGSTVDPTGKWVWTPGEKVDARCFGFMAGPDSLNSQLASLLSWCDSNKRVAYIPGGNYQLASSGSISTSAAIDAGQGVVISSPNGAYTLTLHNPLFSVYSTFAGSNISLVLEGDGWGEKTLKSSVWDSAARGYDLGSSVFGLEVVAGASLVFDHDKTYSLLVVHGLASASVASGTEIHIDHVDGNGLISWTGDAPYFREARRSNINAGSSSIAARCSELFVVDSSLSLIASTTASCLFQVLPPAQLTLGASCTISRGVTGYPGCIAGTNGFASDAGVDMALYVNPNAGMDSWNRSTDSNALDLKSRTVAIAPAKAGKVINGKISANCSVSLILDNVTYSGYFSGETLKAVNCSFSHSTKPIGGGTATVLDGCQITNGSTALTIEDGVSSQWTRVSIIGNVNKYGNGGYWRDVSISGEAVFVPGTSRTFGNFSWVGGSAYRILFNSGLCVSEGPCTMYNVRVQDIINLDGGILANELNTSAMYWATSGHYNVRIGDNENGPATYGFATGTQSAGGDSSIAILGSSSQTLWLSTNHTSDDLQKLARVWNINSYTHNAPGPTWSGEGAYINYPPAIPWIQGSRTRGIVTDNEKCTYQFEIYKKEL